MRKTVPNISGVLMLSVLICSCEAFIRSQGTVLDKQTGKPIPGVTARLLWHHNRDTMEKSGFVADSLSHRERKLARKKGVKDEFTRFDHGVVGWVRPVPAVTDSSGYYKTSTILVGAPFGVPKVSILLTKEGYIPTLLNYKERYDSVFYLQRNK